MDMTGLARACGDGARLADARRGYREGYVQGLASASPSSPSVVRAGHSDRGPATALSVGRSPDASLEPWYTNPLGWGLVAGGLAASLGAIMAHVEHETQLERVVCAEPTAACGAFATRVRLAGGACTARTARDALIGVGTVSLLAGVLTFALWKRKRPDAPPLAPMAGAQTVGLQGALRF